AIAGKQLAHKADAADVDVAILLAEAEAFGEMSPHDIAIEHFHFGSLLPQTQLQRARNRALARAAHPGEPQRKSLVHLVLFRFAFRFCQDIAPNGSIRAEVDAALFFRLQLPPPAAGALVLTGFDGARTRSAADARVSALVKRMQRDIMAADVL